MKWFCFHLFKVTGTDLATDPTTAPATAPRQQSYSKVTVTPRPTFSSPSAADTSDRSKPRINSNTKNTPSPFHLPPSNAFHTLAKSTPPGKPVVFKREKLKLRATISPAILQQLSATADSSEQKSDAAADSIALAANPPAASPLTTSSTPAHQSKKRIKWHQNKVMLV